MFRGRGEGVALRQAKGPRLVRTRTRSGETCDEKGSCGGGHKTHEDVDRIAFSMGPVRANPLKRWGPPLPTHPPADPFWGSRVGVWAAREGRIGS